jgi:hypothetical protein
MEVLARKEREMDDIITRMRISLEKAHVEGISEYIKNLLANSKSEHFEDFLLEGRAALMFSQAGCKVAIRESPDLALKFNNEQFYAEVKHFREKNQDKSDAVRMSGLDDEDELEPYGETFSLEGKHACEQVHEVAIKKLNQYEEHAPNILVIESSSTCIEDTEIHSVIDMINEDVRSGKRTGLAKLNGILLITVDEFNISQWRKVFFYRTGNPTVTLSKELLHLLDNIRFG